VAPGWTRSRFDPEMARLRSGLPAPALAGESEVIATPVEDVPPPQPETMQARKRQKARTEFARNI